MAAAALSSYDPANLKTFATGALTNAESAIKTAVDAAGDSPSIGEMLEVQVQSTIFSVITNVVSELVKKSSGDLEGVSRNIGG